MNIKNPFKTTNPTAQAFARMHNLATSDETSMLDRITFQTAISLLSTAYAYRVTPDTGLLASIANPELTPLARAQDLNRQLIKTLPQHGIPIPHPIQIEENLDEDTQTGGPEYLPEPRHP